MRIRHYFTSVLTPALTASSYDLVSVGSEVLSDVAAEAAEDPRSKTLPRDFSAGRDIVQWRRLQQKGWR